MESKILAALGIDPAVILIIMFILIVVLFCLWVSANMKYGRLKASYASFMKGKDGKTLEECIMDRLDEIEDATEMALKNRSAIKKINEDMQMNVQKVGIVRYDAFQEMGGKLSFALTILDGNDTGCILNSMHSREGCYNYIKEIVKGESYIELSEEEAESLDRAIYQETYGLDLEK